MDSFQLIIILNKLKDIIKITNNPLDYIFRHELFEILLEGITLTKCDFERIIKDLNNMILKYLKKIVKIDNNFFNFYNIKGYPYIDAYRQNFYEDDYPYTNSIYLGITWKNSIILSKFVKNKKYYLDNIFYSFGFYNKNLCDEVLLHIRNTFNYIVWSKDNLFFYVSLLLQKSSFDLNYNEFILWTFFDINLVFTNNIENIILTKDIFLKYKKRIKSKYCVSYNLFKKLLYNFIFLNFCYKNKCILQRFKFENIGYFYFQFDNKINESYLYEDYEENYNIDYDYYYNDFEDYYSNYDFYYNSFDYDYINFEDNDIEEKEKNTEYYLYYDGFKDYYYDIEEENNKGYCIYYYDSEEYLSYEDYYYSYYGDFEDYYYSDIEEEEYSDIEEKKKEEEYPYDDYGYEEKKDLKKHEGSGYRINPVYYFDYQSKFKGFYYKFNFHYNTDYENYLNSLSDFEKFKYFKYKSILEKYKSKRNVSFCIGYDVEYEGYNIFEYDINNFDIEYFNKSENENKYEEMSEDVKIEDKNENKYEEMSEDVKIYEDFKGYTYTYDYKYDEEIYEDFKDYTYTYDYKYDEEIYEDVKIEDKNENKYEKMFENVKIEYENKLFENTKIEGLYDESEYYDKYELYEKFKDIGYIYESESESESEDNDYFQNFSNYIFNNLIFITKNPLDFIFIEDLIRKVSRNFKIKGKDNIRKIIYKLLRQKIEIGNVLFYKNSKEIYPGIIWKNRKNFQKYYNKKNYYFENDYNIEKLMVDKNFREEFILKIEYIFKYINWSEKNLNFFIKLIKKSKEFNFDNLIKNVTKEEYNFLVFLNLTLVFTNDVNDIIFSEDILIKYSNEINYIINFRFKRLLNIFILEKFCYKNKYILQRFKYLDIGYYYLKLDEIKRF